MMRGGPVFWKSMKQTEVETSSCEADYIDSFSAAKEDVWLSRIIWYVGKLLQAPTVRILSEKQGSIDLG